MVRDQKLVEEHNQLSWDLIKWKIAYYLPDRVHPSRMPDVSVPDHFYDKMEQRYLELCRLLDRDNSVVHKVYPGFEDIPGDGMMEVDETRPSVQRVLEYLSKP